MIRKHPVLGIEVSSDGQVRLPRGWSFGRNNRGYRVCLIKRRSFRVHRLIAETFIPNPENKPHVDHINRNPADNRVENLRWVTRSENMRNTKANDRVEKDGHLHTWECKKNQDLHNTWFSDGKRHWVTESEYEVLRVFKPSQRIWKGRVGGRV